jgi:hypothetical protein
MKLLKLLPLLVLPLTLSSCTSSKNESEDDYKPLLVNFFTDYNHVDEKNPYHTYRWYELKPLEEVPPTPECPTEGFPIFLGWSEKPIIDSKEDLWDFEIDTAKMGQYYLALYGIWVADGEI